MFIIFISGVGNAGFSTEVSSVPAAGVLGLSAFGVFSL